jgi:hypothetical protein
MQSSGKLHVARASDSLRYAEQPWQSLTDALSRNITVGYPLFLNVVKPASRSLDCLPLIQWVLHVAAVFVFYIGLCRLKVGKWAAMIVAGSLFFTPHFQEYCRYVLTDGPGSSLAIATLGMMFWVVASRSHKAIWAGLALVLFATYQVRPAYLFLIVLVPVLGLLIFRLTDQEQWRPEWRRLGLRLTLACLLPFLAFSSFRWLMVGHFGLVSFTGTNLIGLAGQFLTEDMVAELPQELRPLAHDVLHRRQTPGQGEPAWKSAYRSGGGLHYVVLEEMYNPTIHQFYSVLNASFQAKQAPHDQVQLDKISREMAVAIIKARPLVYAEWLLKGISHALSFFSHQLRFTHFTILMLLALANLVGPFLGRVRTAGEKRPTAVFSDFLLLKVMAATAVCFMACKLLLIVLVELPIPRYLTAVEIFVPGVLLAAILSNLVRTSRFATMPQLEAGAPHPVNPVEGVVLLGAEKRAA